MIRMAYFERAKKRHFCFLALSRYFLALSRYGEGVGPYVPRFTRDDQKFHTEGVRDFMSLISRARGEGAPGGGPV